MKQNLLLFVFISESVYFVEQYEIYITLVSQTVQKLLSLVY